MKKAKTGRGATNRGLACLEIPDVCKAILAYCFLDDAQSLSAIVLSKATTRSVAEYEELWTGLLIAHYGELRSHPAALRAYRDFVKTCRWRATVAFVCKAKLLERYNKHGRSSNLA
ncbi:hypothetical protein SDRG_00495 [Saprolegnia diclina VS20]|uniref:Uncharacterized protein n=1 Tax=Saprolegnia diclina (strain VS20) TaxID=1156394 RepID=T0SBH5_SAPDV|nr:hypothetical protein SDRG_00495 [Saprolegnia diclina VS20]EQC42773.1 hypothetical protein SDRG_00495 [Saprolegnia diclina VS20]|eukprot:XP_008604196.1 hypothetical protein SDRG_00495 [Saprolegnia diclina VS20]